MPYLNDINELLKQVEQINKKEIIARCGLRTNGDIHIGNILPIISGFILGNELITRGYKYELIIALVDFEDGDEVPFTHKVDENGCHKNLAEHSISIITSFVNKLAQIYPKVNFSLHKISNFLKKDAVKNLINECLRNEDLKRLIKIIPENPNDSNLSFAIDHNLLGTLENIYFKPDVHFIGRDHALVSNNDSPLGLREKYRRILCPDKKSRLLTFLTPLVLDLEGNKMSKTNRNGIFLSQLQKMYGEKIIKLLVGLTKKVIENGNNEVKTEFIIKALMEENGNTK